MAIQLQGNAGTVVEIESATRAMRVAVRPEDVGTLGSYTTLSSSGTIAAGLAAGSAVFAFRYTAANTCLVRAVHFAMCNTTGFTAGMGSLDIIPARSYSVSDGTGSTQLLFTAANSNERRSSFGAPTADIRICTTAALSGGTRTLDAQPLITIRFPVLTTANSNIMPFTDIWVPDFVGEWPLVLATNEGFLLRATVPATGVWILDVITEWVEIASF